MSRRRLLHVASGIVLILLALAAAQGLDRLRPSIAHQQGSFVRSAPTGVAVDLRLASLTVTSVRGSQTVLTPDTRYTAVTDGAFVAVRVKVVPYTEPIAFSMLEARDEAGNRFLPTTLAAQPIATGVTFQPGYGTEGEIVFEVPAESAPSLRLWAQIPAIARADTVADLPLGIRPADVAAWQASSETLVPHDLEVSP